MFPYLNLFGFQVPMYSIMIGLGLILGVLLAVFRAKRSGLKGEDVFNACLFAVIGLIVGGKILYLITIIPWMAEKWSRLMSTPQLWIDPVSYTHLPRCRRAPYPRFRWCSGKRCRRAMQSRCPRP